MVSYLTRIVPLPEIRDSICMLFNRSINTPVQRLQPVRAVGLEGQHNDAIFFGKIQPINRKMCSGYPEEANRASPMSTWHAPQKA